MSIKRYKPVIAVGPADALPGMVEDADGRYAHFSDCEALIDALKATVAYMEDDSGGYEVYRATLDTARQALADGSQGEKE